MMQGGSSEARKAAVWKSDGKPSLTGYEKQKEMVKRMVKTFSKY